MSSSYVFDAIQTRELIAGLPQPAAKESLRIDREEIIHVPRSHLKALDWQASIVVGARGCGKSFWTAALFDEQGREYLQQHSAVSNLLKDLAVQVGFGLGNDPTLFPAEDELRRLRAQGIPVRSIWQAVVLRHAVREARLESPFGAELEEAIMWVHEQGASATRLLAVADAALAQIGKRLLILFDALERLAGSWDSVREHTTAILRVALDCRSTRAMRCKVFLRPDLNDDERIWQFSESSKLTQTKVSLDWRAIELYALLIVSMGNHEQSGSAFREALTKLTGVEWQSHAQRFSLPDVLLGNESKIREVIEALCGTYMGSNAKRGHVFTWIPTHLADAFSRATPRSLITAFKKAADSTEENHHEHELPIHYEGIQEGVRAASETRNAEVREDYPWVETLLSALRGRSVPMERSDFAQAWKPLERQLSMASSRLPPRRYSGDPSSEGKMEALLLDLSDLGISYETDDGRYNIVDIYRVHAGIGRKGGVKPSTR